MPTETMQHAYEEMKEKVLACRDRSSGVYAKIDQIEDKERKNDLRTASSLIHSTI